MSQLSYWLIASVLLVATFGYRTYRANRVLAGRLEEEHRRAQQMGELHLATIEALALAIDAKDQTTHNHVGRVEFYASALARALGMSDADLQAVKTAALLHDIGKLGVPEHILAKPGPLTPDEFQRVRMHPQIGADIIGAVPFPYPVAPLVLAHHERWDGRGYPMGLQGEQIPLGARILCLVDYFDAVTSDRTYHKPLSVDAAAALIQEEAGKALDPRAVDAFVRILPDLRVQAEHSVSDRRRLTLPLEDPNQVITSCDGVPIAGSPRAAAMSRQQVFEDIAVAHREIYALYELAQSMGTTLGVTATMGHIASKLSRVVPFSACSLSLYSEDDDTLRCRFAAGTDAELLKQLVLKGGQGLTGWVARNRRALVNGRPSADFHASGSVIQTTLESALVCPLISENAVIGTLAVYHTTEAFYCDDHRRLLDRVCEQASAVIRNAIVFDQTHEASLTDPLTGLPNTRFMFRHVTRELARTHRLGAEVSLLVLDLNGFKNINDTYGHNAGDLALREVANVLRTSVRPYDICARYAGDEFVIVLAGCSREEAEHKRRELQQGIEQIVFQPMPGRSVPLSIAVGAAVFPHDGDTYESLLATADRRMYQDKGAHRHDTQRQPDAAHLDVTPAGDYEITAV